MANDYTVYQVTVSTLTPLHIGNGRDLLHEYDYAIHNGRTWRINEAALLDAQDVDDAALASKLAALKPASLLKPPADFRVETGYFRYVIQGTPRSQAPGAQLREQLKDVYDRPYLPGSSLKGALRTGLAWFAWRQGRLTPQLKDLGRRREWAAQGYEHMLFGPNPNHDALRALQVSDSQAVGADRLMLVNARVLGRGGGLGSPIELEAVRPETVFELTLKIDQVLFSAWAREARLNLPGGDWFSRLAEIMRAHALQRIQREASWFQAIPGAARLAEFYRGLSQAKLPNNHFLVQVGWGAGWEAKTLGLHFQKDPAFMERIIDDYRLARGKRKVGDPFPKSRRVAVRVERGPNGERRETPASPLGWMLVEMEPGR